MAAHRCAPALAGPRALALATQGLRVGGGAHVARNRCPSAASRLTGRAPLEQEAGGGTELPADFDWQQYLHWNRDLARHGLQTEAEAKRHFLRRGRAEARLHKHYCVIMLYDASGGVCARTQRAFLRRARPAGPAASCPLSAARDQFTTTSS